MRNVNHVSYKSNVPMYHDQYIYPHERRMSLNLINIYDLSDYKLDYSRALLLCAPLLQGKMPNGKA